MVDADMRRRQQGLLRGVANQRLAMAVESTNPKRKGWLGRLFGLRLATA